MDVFYMEVCLSHETSSMHAHHQLLNKIYWSVTQSIGEELYLAAVAVPLRDT